MRKLYNLFNIAASILAALVFGFNTVRSIQGDHPAEITALFTMLTGLCVWLAAVSISEARHNNNI